MRRIIVIGTGTAVGKTYVSCCLLRALRRADPSARVIGLKPIESGVGTDHSATDAGMLEAASIGAPPPNPHPLYAFPDPLSPHLAAQRAGASPIDLNQVRSWLEKWERDVMTRHVVSRSGRTAESTRAGATLPDSTVTGRTNAEERDFGEIGHATRGAGWVVVETAGAVLSPLGRGLTNFDLARALEPATWVLVAADALGTLHEVTATLEALSARGRVPEHLFMSASRVDASTGTNADELRALRIANVSAVIGRNGGGLDQFAKELVSGAREPRG